MFSRDGPELNVLFKPYPFENYGGKVKDLTKAKSRTQGKAMIELTGFA